MSPLSARTANQAKLSINGVSAILSRQGLIDKRTQETILANGDTSGDTHPITQIASLELASTGEQKGPLSAELITRSVAEFFNLPYVRIDPLKIDVAAVTDLVSQGYATRYQFLPIKVAANQITIATAEPNVDEWITDIRPILKRDIERVIANPADISRYIKEFYGVSKSIGIANNDGQDQNVINNFEQLTQLGSIGELDADNHHIVHLVDWLLQFAFEQRASDIHIEPRRAKSNIRFRIDGVLHLVHQIDTQIVQAITSRIKSLGRMDVADKRRPQDGRIKTKSDTGLEVELRLSTMPTTFGEKLVLRIFNPEKLAQSFTALGFTEDDETIWQNMVANPHGIILVTGPTGSGKTTTLYSGLKQLARPEINVCTIEDPIEMVEPAFNQMQVQPSIDLDFASGVRTLLRQDPDTIMIGEIRDKETADVAAQAALTGHLVLSTLHTNDAPSAITRLQDIGLPSYLIGATLLGVVAQRLVRTLCGSCQFSQPVDEAAWLETLGDTQAALPIPEFTMAASGCDDCRQTGFRGREGIYEMLHVTDALRPAIVPDMNHRELREHALANGMTPLRLAGARKVASGVTTLSEILSVVPPTDAS
ncbi:MAG: GspE/PulE family protein [Pseudomonadota bacterium]